jgi:hypothetical protein
MASHGENARPIRRASRYEGLYVLDVDEAAVARIAMTIEDRRGSLDGFDLAINAGPDTDLDAMASAGATWAMRAFDPCDPVSLIEAAITGR